VYDRRGALSTRVTGGMPPGPVPPAPLAAQRGLLARARAVAAPAAGARAQPWDPLLLAVALYILTSVGRIQQVFTFLTPLRPTLLAGVLSIGLFVFSKDRRRSLARLRHPITTTALAMFALVAVSVPLSIGPGISLKFLLNDFAKTIVLFLVVAGSVRSYADIRRLGFVFLLSATIYSTVLLVRTGGVGTARLGEEYTYDANDIALLIAMAIPFAFFGVVNDRRLAARLFGVYALLVNAVAFIKTGSRGGFLAAIVLFAFYALLNRGVRKSVRFSVVGLVVIVLAFAGPSWYWEQMHTLTDPGQDYNVSSETGRIQVWKRGIGYMMSNPVTGVGAACFQRAEGTLSDVGRQLAAEGKGWKWSAAHNSFLQAGAELGLPGLIVFVVLLYHVFRTFFTLSRRASRGRGRAAREASGLAFAGASAMVAFAVAGFFLSQAYSGMLFTIAGFAVAMAKLARAEQQARLAPAVEVPRP
jgi:O-antigen ligase